MPSDPGLWPTPLDLAAQVHTEINLQKAALCQISMPLLSMLVLYQWRENARSHATREIQLCLFIKGVVTLLFWIDFLHAAVSTALKDSLWTDPTQLCCLQINELNVEVTQFTSALHAVMSQVQSPVVPPIRSNEIQSFIHSHDGM